MARAVAELPGSMTRLSGESPGTISRSRPPPSWNVNLKQQREGLNRTEEDALNRLTEAYERFLLLRAEAASLLHRRGHDVSELIRPV